MFHVSRGEPTPATCMVFRAFGILTS